MAPKDNALAVAAPLAKTIVFAVIGLMILALLFLEFGEIRLYDRNTYSAVMSNASGLRPASSVTANGVKIGKVDSVEVFDNDKAIISFTIDAKRPLTMDVEASIRYQNLTGDQYVDLSPGSETGAVLPVGGTIPLTQTSPALDLDVLLGGFDPLFQGLQPDEINTLTSELITVLQGQSGTFESLFTRVASLTGSLADRDQVIGDVITNFNTVLGSLDSNSTELSDTLLKAQEVVTTLSEDRTALLDGAERTAAATRTVGEVIDGLRSGRSALRELGRAAGTLDDQRDELDRILGLMPGAYLRLGRVSSYGAGYNIFICSLQFRLTGADGQPFLTPLIGPSPSVEACRDGDIAPLDGAEPGSGYPEGSEQQARELAELERVTGGLTGAEPEGTVPMDADPIDSEEGGDR